MMALRYWAIVYLLSSSPIAQNINGPWVLPEVEIPGVQRIVFDSQTVGQPVSFAVFTPDSYTAHPDQRFPVVYWLHGTGGGIRGIGPITAHFSQAMQQGLMPPALIVFPNGLASSMWIDSPDGVSPVETLLTQEIIPRVDQLFRTRAHASGRMVEGFSMGGYGAARLGLLYPKLFGSVSLVGAGPLDLNFSGPRARANPAERAAILARTYGGDMSFYRQQNPLSLVPVAAATLVSPPIIRIVVGEQDTMLPGNQRLSELLSEHGIEHTFHVSPGARHQTLETFNALGNANWTFYQTAFAISDPRSPNTVSLPPYSTAGPSMVSVILILVGFTVFGTVLVSPCIIYCRVKKRGDWWRLPFIHVPALAIHVTHAFTGLGAPMSLGNLVEFHVITVTSAALTYLKVFGVDRITRQPMPSTYVLASVLMALSFALRLMMPTVQE